VGLAKVKKVAPKVRMNLGKTECDAETLQAILTHRYYVMTKYAKSLKAAYGEELRRLKARAGTRLEDIRQFKAVKRWLDRDAAQLKLQEKAQLDAALSKSKALSTAYALRQELVSLWQRSTATKEQLVKQLEDWCRRAEASGVVPLQEFSRSLRCFA
jgi:stearoyl-CoA desaturase (delta-9 desaturase)